MKSPGTSPRRSWAAWLLMLAMFAQAFAPALAQAALAQTQVPWGQLCSSANSQAERWTQHDSSSAPASHVQIPHCAYCLLGGAAAPPPAPVPITAWLAFAPVFAAAQPVAPPPSGRTWLLPPLRAPPRTFA